MVVALPAGVSPLFPDSERNLTARQLQSSHDAQLLRALELLQEQDHSARSAALPSRHSPA